MQEEFVNIAMDAFKEASGDTDKFELYIRRKVMSMKTIITPQTQVDAYKVPQMNAIAQSNIPSFVSPNQVDSFIQSLDPNNPLLNELASMDVSRMSDNEVLSLAQKMGFLNTSIDNMTPQQETVMLSDTQLENE